ncbi:MAG TPA: hypothetical protein HA254_06740 [Candidatus Diapherotrites archaeon]|uniref:PIN domain-containing protein n=1 Tax=Candidatus Iainarchaeum sp. TaxID=3101447 RepID=A0A7J4IXP0_9ARCH|nr:hypothetical protein [Candidatus Diapherotrites archaeon]
MRAILIRDFILKCKEKRAPLSSSATVYSEVKFQRYFLRQELTKQGFGSHEIGRILQVAEVKVKEFLTKITIHQNLSHSRLSEVTKFFQQYASDPRLVALAAKKQSLGQAASTIPGNNDLKILAEALTLQNLYFVTTDEHYYILIQELESKFTFTLICPDNVHTKLSEFGWE